MNIDNQIREWAKMAKETLHESVKDDKERDDEIYGGILDAVETHKYKNEEHETELTEYIYGMYAYDWNDEFSDQSGMELRHSIFEIVSKHIEKFISDFEREDLRNGSYSEFDDYEQWIHDKHYMEEGMQNQLDEVSDVDVDWNDEELKNAEDRESKRRYQNYIDIKDLGNDVKLKLFYSMLETLKQLFWYGKDNLNIKYELKYLKNGELWWNGISKDVVDKIYDYVTSVDQLSKSMKNSKEIRNSREEN